MRLSQNDTTFLEAKHRQETTHQDCFLPVAMSICTLGQFQLKFRAEAKLACQGPTGLGWSEQRQSKDWI